MVGVGRNGRRPVATTDRRQQMLMGQKRQAQRCISLVEDRMGEFNVLVYCLLYELSVFLLVRLGNNMPYELLNAGINVFLAVTRHGRIFAAIFGKEKWSDLRFEYGHNKGA